MVFVCLFEFIFLLNLMLEETIKLQVDGLKTLLVSFR